MANFFLSNDLTPGQLILRTIARFFKVPPSAVEMFTAANQLSGLDSRTLPTELIPLNTIQLSRGLLNFALLQSARHWVVPFWAEQQYSPNSPAFVPRSHLGLSINVTHRNWTAVGNPRCPVEPVVDPRGLVTPFRNGWSIDTWLAAGDRILFPSREAECRQSLINDLPIVETSFSGAGLTLTTYTVGSTLHHRVNVKNMSERRLDASVLFAVRPFNPEGISLIRSLAFDRTKNRFTVNESDTIAFDRSPESVVCSTLDGGDSSSVLHGGEKTEARCGDGLANGFARFDVTLDAGSAAEIGCSVPLEPGSPAGPQVRLHAEAEAAWDSVLTGRTSITTPDAELNALLKASLSSLLMLADGDEITPGPLTYHQFWFRDAAYMVSALDKFGCSDFTHPIIHSFPARQESSGFFRSQQGEWDSNGQTLWLVWQHALRTHSTSVLSELISSLARGADWIDRKRFSNGKGFPGLLPPGLSAEHLGLVDYYFWDNAWSLAGLESLSRMSGNLGRNDERREAMERARRYRADIERAIAAVQRRFDTEVIPASPSRGIDCGMIGSCSFWYPLQLLPPDDPRMLASLRMLTDRFTHKGLFFQDFVHSGMNAYLTLQIAQAWLYGGYRREFWSLLRAVCSQASATRTFPEAIHPLTGGGCMGDGHHGWVSAEILHAMRDAFVQERWAQDSAAYDLLLLAGLPAAWFQNGTSIGISSAPVPEGILTMLIHSENGRTAMTMQVEKKSSQVPEQTVLRLPMTPAKILADNREQIITPLANGESSVILPEGTKSVMIFMPAPQECPLSGTS